MVGVGIYPKGLLVEGGATKIIQAREGPWLLRRAHCLCVFSDRTEVTLSTSPSSMDGAEWPVSQVWRCGLRPRGFALGLRHLVLMQDKGDRDP